MLAKATRLDPVGQASYRALETRRLLRVADKHGQPVLTDRVLSSYRDSLADRARSSSGRVFDCGPTGLPLGMDRVSLPRFEELLTSGTVTGPRNPCVDRGKRFAGDHLAQFVASERALLADMATAASARDTDPRLGALLAEADYVWTHFPDVPDLSAPDRGFAARARVAAQYYGERLRRVESVL